MIFEGEQRAVAYDLRPKRKINYSEWNEGAIKSVSKRLEKVIFINDFK